MKKIFTIAPMLLLAYCSTAEKENTGVTQNSKSSASVVSSSSSSATENFSTLKEGWVNLQTARAIISIKEDEMMTEEAENLLARERLAWLLLLESYNLSREDKLIATRLAASESFIELAPETVRSNTHDGVKRILMEKSGSNFQGDWEAFLVRIEKKYPELSAKRKSH